MAEGSTKISEEELFQCLKSLNVPVRMSDLKTPTRDFMIRVFECCLKDLHIDITSHNFRPLNCIKHFENPEIYHDATMLVLLIISINTLTNTVSITINDITDPKPKRTKKILNYLLVFWNFCLRKYADFNAAEEEMADNIDQVNNLIDEIKCMEKQLAEVYAKLQEFGDVDELASRVASKFAKSRELKSQFSAVEKDLQEDKKKEKELFSLISSVEVEILSVKEKTLELDQLILTSPERLNADLQKIKESVKSEEMRLREKDSELKQKKKDQEVLLKAQEDVLKTTDILRGVYNNYKELSTVIDSIAINNKNCKEEEEKVNKMASDLGLKEQFQSMAESTAAQKQMTTLKQTEALKITIDGLKRDLAEVQENSSRLKANKLVVEQEIEDIIQYITKIVDLCKEAEALTEKKEGEFKDTMERNLANFISDCDELECALKKSFGK